MGDTGVRRLPALDGLRGVAILLVVGNHAGLPWLPYGGAVGVTLFFVLSGFLITRLLLAEHEATGTVRIGVFYARRAARLLPALILMLLAFVAYVAATGRHVTVAVAASVAALSYCGNWIGTMVGGLGPLGHTWSLAVEEQFYLVWPLMLLALLRRPRLLLPALLAGIAASAAWRWWLLLDGSVDPLVRVYTGTDTVAYALLAGCVLAVVEKRIVARAWWAIAGTLALVALAGPSGHAYVWLGPVHAAAAAVAVAGALAGAAWLEGAVLRFLGRVSYGWYLWHVPALFFAHAEGAGLAVSVAVAVATLGVASASWRWVEQPVIRWTSRRGSAPHLEHDRPIVGAVVERRGSPAGALPRH